MAALVDELRKRRLSRLVCFGWILSSTIAVQALPQVPIAAEPEPPRFPPEVVRVIGEISPGFLDVLRDRKDADVRKLITVLVDRRRAEAMPIFLWILEHGDAQAYGRWVASLMAAAHRSPAPAPINDVRRLMADSDVLRRRVATWFFDSLFQSFRPTVTPAERQLVVDAMIAGLRDADQEVLHSAATTLFRLRSREATLALAESLSRPDLRESTVLMIMEALGATEDPRAVPVLTEWAMHPGSRRVKEKATQLVVSLSKAADPNKAARDLLWEPPDTNLERTVLNSQGQRLASAWQALLDGAPGERRAAAALLSWFRSRDSVPHILQSLSMSPSQEIRKQLLFDLNAIALTEGSRIANVQDRNGLATLYLQDLFSDVKANPSIYGDVRSALLGATSIRVLAAEVSSSFELRLAANGATLSVAESAEEFHKWLEVSKGCGVAFHVFRQTESVARIAATVFMPGGRVVRIAWVGLYTGTSGQWTRLAFESHDNEGWRVGTNLYPTIYRNYGPDDPLKLVRLDLRMERIRTLNTARTRFIGYDYDFEMRDENLRADGMADLPDHTYIPLLQVYRRSDSRIVRQAAEFQLARLTGEPNLPFLLEMIENERHLDIQAQALQVLEQFMLEKFKQEGRPPTAVELATVAAAAITPKVTTSVPIPQRLPSAEAIDRISLWQEFALVEITFRIGPTRWSDSGYSMLLQQVGSEWRYVCVLRSWIQ